MDAASKFSEQGQLGRKLNPSIQIFSKKNLDFTFPQILLGQKLDRITIWQKNSFDSLLQKVTTNVEKLVISSVQR